MAVLSLALPHVARAQVGASIALQSDYRYRGYSLTDLRPAVALNLSFDHEGLYAGGTAFAADTPERGVRVRGEIVYAGYAAKTSLGPGLDLGISHTRFISYRGRKRAVEFDEVYAGVVGDHLSARLAYSPRYLGQDVETLYLDLGAAYRPAPDWRLFAHAGAFVPVSGREYPAGRRKRYDLSAGVARRIRRTELSLYWTHLSPVLVYSNGKHSERNAVVASASYFF